MRSRKAEMGIGTLIIFIAMILVAGITASVLVQTGSSLQAKALSAAKSARTSVSTKLNVVHISATDGSAGTLRNFEQYSQLAPGSDAINLEGSVLVVELSNSSADLTYSSESCTNASSSAGNGYFTDSTLKNGTFTVSYLQVSDSHSAGIIARGETVKLCFSSPRLIGRDEQVQMRFIPKYGSQTSVEFITPEVITTEFVRVYP